jgi:hypothetical protein
VFVDGAPPRASRVELSDRATSKWSPWTGGDMGLQQIVHLSGVRSLLLGSPIERAESLAFLRQMPALRVLEVDGPHAMNDDGMRYVGECAQLEELQIFFAAVTDEGFLQVRHLKKLRILRACWVSLTDKAMSAVRPLVELRNLSVSGRGITDAGLEPLRGRDKLVEIGLFGTGVTDAGLDVLKGLKGLRELDVRATRVTARAIADLRSALPDCHVEFEPGSGTKSNGDGRSGHRHGAQ